MVIFEDGLKLDVVISKAHKEDNLIDLLTDSPYTQVFRRGYRILLDRSKSKEPEIHACDQSPLIPSLESFSGTFDNALIAITRAAKFNKRDDLWRAQHTLGEIRRAALQFIEWHTLVCNESQVDFWYDGRDLNSWTGATINEKVPGLFAAYE